jgi:hypothetical protein
VHAESGLVPAHGSDETVRLAAAAADTRDTGTAASSGFDAAHQLGCTDESVLTLGSDGLEQE